MPPTAPCGVDSHPSRSVFHGAFSAGDGDAVHSHPHPPFDTMHTDRRCPTCGTETDKTRCPRCDRGTVHGAISLRRP